MTARRRARKSVPHTLRGLRSIILSVCRRADFELGDLAELHELRHVIDVAETEAIAALHERGASWATLASELGVTRQALHERQRRRRG